MNRPLPHLLITMMLCCTLWSCNKDEVITATGEGRPTIEIESEYGVLTVKVGEEITVQPLFTNMDCGTVMWMLDDEAAGEGLTFSRRFDEAGEHYLTVTARNEAGSATLDLRIDVVELTPPRVTFTDGEGRRTVLAGSDYVLEPEIEFADGDDFLAVWYVDDMESGRGTTFVFNREEQGLYRVGVAASNSDGTTTAEIEIEVVASLPGSVRIVKQTAMQRSDERYAFAGQPVTLRAETENIDDAVYAWSVDGTDAGCGESMFTMRAPASGRHIVAVTARSATVTGQIATATVTVVCAEGGEMSRFRAATASSRATACRVFEFMPAPGQFVNESMSGAENSASTAAEWALGCLEKNYVVSLGAFGGYIVAGFDHSIPCTGGVDFAIGGNAFVNDAGGSNEPGIVWVMQDANGNGLPDDEWYELRGSEHGSSGTIRGYAVTYHRPSSAGKDVKWTDSEGNSGYVKYMAAFHSQPYYYPQWVESATYTLRGTRLEARNYLDAVSGQWCNPPFGWGYADNVGSDYVGNPAGGPGQQTGFSIANAVSGEGTAVELKYIDFVMVQTGVQSQSGALGEVSTEVSSLTDMTLGR